MRWLKRKEAQHGYLVENVGVGKSGVGVRMGVDDDAHETAASFESGAGNDGIRHPRRRARGNSDSGNHGVPAQVAGAVERHCGRHQRIVRKGKAKLASRKGQATVEFAVIAAGFLAVTVALMAFWRVLGGGLLVEHALAVASHHIQSVAPATLPDIFLY